MSKYTVRRIYFAPFRAQVDYTEQAGFLNHASAQSYARDLLQRTWTRSGGAATRRYSEVGIYQSGVLVDWYRYSDDGSVQHLQAETHPTELAERQALEAEHLSIHPHASVHPVTR